MASWLQAQRWRHLLFAHWPVPVEALRPQVPEDLEVETFDGSAWIGITPFRLTGLRLRRLPPVPVLSSFLELNVRTYVTREGRPGIWFFSLDAASRLAVAAARLVYRLPYHHARMRARWSECWLVYELRRGDRVFEGRYRPAGAVFQAQLGTLEHFLVERYRLWTLGPARAEIQHPPWQLRRAEAEILVNTMAPPGVVLATEPLLHYAERQDVVIWPLA